MMLSFFSKQFNFMPMKTILLTFAFAFTLQIQCLAQTFDPTWADRFQTVLDSLVKAKNIKGASAAVLVPGQGIWTGVSGISTYGEPITPDMRFGIASNTKLFTAVLLLKLQEQGVLSLDDQLDKWLPSYPNIDSSATIRQVLSHQAGFYDIIEDNPGWSNTMLANPTHLWTREEILSKTGAPAFAPGQGWKYSSTGYILLSLVIEAATGKSYTQNMHELIFNPLELNETFIAANEEPNGPVALEWNGSNELTNTPMIAQYSFFSAAGAIFSTARNMVKWYNDLFRGKVLSENSLQQLTNFDPVELYGLGLIAFSINHPYYFHPGIAIGYKSTTCYITYRKSALCILTNSGTNYDRYYMHTILLPLLKVLDNEYPLMKNDAGIVAVTDPKQHVFSETIEPTVTMRNFGLSPLTSAIIHYQLDNNESKSMEWTGLINTDTTTTVKLPAIAVSEGMHQLTIYTSDPNEQTEGYNYNDTLSMQFIRHIVAIHTGPFTEDFKGPEFPPDGWIINLYTGAQWQHTSLYSCDDNYSVVKNNYSDLSNGTIYDLDMPLLNLAGMDNPTLIFNYAYAYSFGRNDSLIILLSSDHGVKWDTLFCKGGMDLSTSFWTYNCFHPGQNHWKKATIPLKDYSSSDVLIRFRAINYNGNNLYFDEVEINELPVGINKLSSKESMQLYPIPATDRITITGLPLNSDIIVTDIHGRTIRILKTDSETMNLPLDGFTKGIYILRSTVGMKLFIIQ